MAKDAELDRLKAAQDLAFQRKQDAYQAQQRAWEKRSSARDTMNRAYEAKQRAVLIRIDAGVGSEQGCRQGCRLGCRRAYPH